jgi:vacuolar-type H+-ATPase subunit F/Vma7
MKPLVIGTREDVAGFALAGLEGVVCATREEAGQAILRADEDTLLIISPEFAREVPRDRLAIGLPARP